jgi:hypothetical protein
LSDKEWLRQIDERWEESDDDEDVNELMQGKKKKGIGRKKEDGTPEATEPAKRGRKRKKAMDDEV